ncbi:hypothetical protein [Alkalimarinus coralli]|uniref:hypothetical protein n=1 Tax=Alkalimarinus coralli TaxID=2935863 RepID=UPI00202AEFF4|nr:hypothetical protein [Alkalimarinus coralli]
MSNCIGWAEEFQQNMDALGVPAPTSLFDSYDKAVTTLGNIIAVSSINLGVSAAAVLSGELGAAPLTIGLAALSASAYAGMVTGSMMVATSKQLGCAMKSRIMPVTVNTFLIKNGIYDGGRVYAEMHKNPQLMAMTV